MNREGQKVPKVTFRTRIGNDWKNVTSVRSSAASGGRCLPCPARSHRRAPSSHLPRYNELAPALFANGIETLSASRSTTPS